MSAGEMVFWVSIGAVAYTYALYPLLLFVLAAVTQTWRDLSFLLRRRNRRGLPPQERLPRVSILIAAYNEEIVIEAKLRNTAELAYPADKLEILVGLDSPSDSTAERARSLAGRGIRIIEFPQRRGKLAVMNDLVEQSTGDIVVSTDANTFLHSDAIQKLVRHFTEPEVGAVCTEVVVTDPSGKALNESLYWRYEVALKFLENRLNCVLGGTGGLYAVRRQLFPRVNAVVEDFLIVMQIRWEGHRVVYDPECLSTEASAPTLAAEYQRKVRIGAGVYQTLLHNPRFLNPFKGLPAFAYFSHKVVRWLAPLFLIAALVTNAMLVARPLFAATLVAQLAFYLLAFYGYARQRRGAAPGGLASVAYYFSVMNLALLHGLARYLSGRQQVTWSATPRRAAAANTSVNSAVSGEPATAGRRGAHE